MINLPSEVIAQLEGSSRTGTIDWALPETVHRALLEALGRALASSDTAGFIATKCLAFAVGDNLVYPATANDAAGLIADNTAIVQHLERSDPAFQQMVSDLSLTANRRVSISAYVADVHSRAFAWHVDKWDNVVLQLQGTKEFHLAGGRVRELHPGDALFLPQDVRHRSLTVARSVHLSVAFFPRAVRLSMHLERHALQQKG